MTSPNRQMNNIRYRRIIQLSHVLEPGMPHWPGDPRLSTETVAELATHGYRLHRVCLGEHAGTHVVAGATYREEGWAIDSLSAERLVLPAVVLDAQEQAWLAPDYALSVEDVTAWESRHGTVGPGVLAILHSGWHRRWSRPDDYLGLDDAGQLHFPGFGLDAARRLVERGVAGLATDSPGLEVGTDRSYAVSRLLTDHCLLAVENLANVDQLPPRGATIVVAPLPFRGGTGAPALVLGLIP